MSRDSVRYLIPIALIVVTALAVLVVTQNSSLPTSGPVEAVDEPGGISTEAVQEYVVITDVDGWQSTSYERAVKTPFAFFEGDWESAELPLSLGPWSGEDLPVDNQMVFILLEPDWVLSRSYYRDEDMIWCNLVGSRQSKSFHPPEICYSSIGWDVSHEGVKSIPLRSTEIYARSLTATKGGTQHAIVYLYLWSSPERNVSQGSILITVGAPIQESLERTFALETYFLAHLFSDSLGWRRF
jgi:hypothetical protein